MMCWHRWTGWQQVEIGDITADGRKVGWALLQKRQCVKCKKVELDRQKKLIM